MPLNQEAVILKTPEEIEKMRKSGSIVAHVHAVLREKIKPGMTTMDLEVIAEKETEAMGAKPAFKGYHGFPFCLCTSVNEEVVHGMPSAKRVLNEGDIVGVDFGVLLDGFYGDSAHTLAVGTVSEDSKKLMDATKKSLDAAIEKCVVGNRLQDISAAVQKVAEAEGFSIVRDYTGHGIGRGLHEPPQVPNFGTEGKGIRLKEGMVLAIEPMVNEGTYHVKVLDDGWTVVTKDGKRSAHYEHTIAITAGGPDILTRLL